MISTRQSDSNEHNISVDVIEDYLDADKDVIMKLTLCFVRDIVFTTYIIKAFAPKQLEIQDLGLLRCFISDHLHKYE